MTLIICPVRPGEDNPELRYALRSWETNLVMPDLRLMVVGHKPSWLNPDLHVAGNRHKEPGANVFDNIRLGMESAAQFMMPEAIIVNDDFFCLDPVPGVVPVRRNISLAQHMTLLPQYQGMWWGRSLALTASWLAEQGYPSPWSYEVHRPLPCKPAAMLSALARWDKPLVGDLPQWRTMYGVLNNIEAHPVEDVKLGSTSFTLHSAWASTSDNSWRRHSRMIMPRFQKPSRWER